MAKRINEGKSLVTGLDKVKNRNRKNGPVIKKPAPVSAVAQADPDTKHPEYEKYAKIWKRCRDAAIGQRAIQAAGNEYLPELAGQESTEYEKYKARANFFGATGRTIEAMVGAVFRKPGNSELPPVIKTWGEDITLSEETLTDFAQECLTEVLEVGRGGILVDAPLKSEDVRTQADQEKKNVRPYLTFYPAESIINFEVKRINNVRKLCNVWLMEDFQDGNMWGKQVRQLTLNADGEYQQILHRKIEGTTAWITEDPITPAKSNKAFTEIPFYPLGVKNSKIDFQDAPLESLVDVNISHYMNSADLENGAHISGCPTLYIAGYQEEKNEAGDIINPIYVGSNTALVLPDPNAKVDFAQVGQEGFATLETLMETKERYMAQLGAQLLMPEKKAAEAAQTAEIRRGGQNSVLASIVRILDRQLTKALQFAADWYNVGGKIAVELNKDYFPVVFTAQDLTAWVAANQSGRVSDETFWQILQQSEWIPEDVTFEVEKQRKEDSGPTLSDTLGNPKDKPNPKPGE